MKKLMLVILFALITRINAQDNQKYINVNGSSEITVNADQIEIGVNIRTVEKSIEESKKVNNKAVDELLTILKSIGIDKQDIETSPVSLGKNYEYKNGERIQNGYFTNVAVSLLLKDLSKYYVLIDKVSLNDSFEIINSTYKVSDHETQLKNAYEKALLAAKEKAEFMAKTLGVKLGEVIEVEENNSYGSPMQINAFAKEDRIGGEVSGKVTINKSVRIKFAIM